MAEVTPELPVAEVKTDVKMLTPEQVNHIVEERLNRERSKYADYDDLKKFRSEHDKQADELKQKELESRAEYDKLKESWISKENEYKTLIGNKEHEIASMMVDNALTNEVMKNNAYGDAVQLIRASTVIKDGKVFVKGKDTNGFDTELPVDEGVKKFLESKPYLLKSTARAGSGTAGAAPSVMGSGEDLADQLMKARSVGDFTKANEIKKAIRAKNNL